ncbi:carbohydrate-binding module family 32 protein [Lepidopterella palustris CBS 459.81]|uniref:alpha,alpha-trehalase n=1 Tax=Lepidopterella palustris CBS 459.81 TaxID=1314670 RepID=A0A8E2E1S8_9PEZI|nr:carbohydrate-binding module family 32 protein [Lepidopterella palustris CBS 459.81]
MMRLLSLSSALISLLGGSSIAAAIAFESRYPNVTWDDDNWRITTTNLDQGHYESRVSLANGYLGINVAAAGPFFEVDEFVHGDNINGWPIFNRRQTFATIAGFYDYQPQTNGSNFPWLYQYGGESVISGVPHWGGLVVEAGGQVLNASVDQTAISGFSSTLDIRAGLMSWSYTWTPTGEAPLLVEYNMFVHKLYVNQAAIQLKLTASRDMNVTVVDVLDGDCAVRTDFVDRKFETDSPTIWSAVRPNGISNVTAYIYSTLNGNGGIDMSTRVQVTDGVFGSNQSSIAQSIDISLVAGQTTIVEKYVGGASTDAFDNPQAVARNASLSGANTGFVDMLHSHMEEWASILTPDSVDDYSMPDGTLPADENIRELQIIAVTNPFHILQNTVGVNAILKAGNNSMLDVNSISVCGLGSDCYAGLIFWDAEVWMAPGLAISHPESVKQIANYRVQKYPQAQENINMAYSSSQNETGKFTTGGAVFPWTSGRFGNCTGTGPCFDYEYHINGDIGLELANYYIATGDAEYFKNYLLPIYNSIAYFYSELLTLNETTGVYALLNATDPDEYANNVDNPGYTTALVQKHLNLTNVFNSWFGLPVNETWTNQASKMRLPVDEQAHLVLEYSTMNASISVKQADVVLLDDILDYPNEYTNTDLDYYAARQSLNGPGMTYGVFSIVANEVSPSGCSSYTYDLYGSQPYTRPPWFQFSEQLLDNHQTNGGTHPAFPFLTGMGGANRVAIYGYLSLRLFADHLDVDPSIPPQIPYISYRTFYWQGHALNATSNTTHTTIQRLPRALDNANSTYATSPIPVTLGVRRTQYSLPPNGTIVIPNRQVGQTATVAGNIAQCHPVSSQQEFMSGQFPLAAVDGAASTKWQPARSNETSVLTVDLGDVFYPISAFAFDWAANPPLSFDILFSNATIPSFTTAEVGTYVNATSSNTVAISNPYDPTVIPTIAPYVGNTTNVTLASVVWSGRYAHLMIRGNAEDPGSTNATGATVAEWSIISEGGGKVVPVRYSPRRESERDGWWGV